MATKRTTKPQPTISPIQIDAKIHEKVKRYCESRGLKIGRWVEKLITDYLNGNLARTKKE